MVATANLQNFFNLAIKNIAGGFFFSYIFQKSFAKYFCFVSNAFYRLTVKRGSFFGGSMVLGWRALVWSKIGVKR